MARKIMRLYQLREVFIALADFDFRWGVRARGSGGKEGKKGGVGGG